MRHQDLLDLGWKDVEASADDHVLLAVDDVDKAVGVLETDVSGVMPAEQLGFGGRLGVVVVVIHDDVTAHDDLALLPCAQQLAGLVHDGHAHHRALASGTAQPAFELGIGQSLGMVLRRKEGATHQRLALAIALGEYRAEQRHGLAQLLNGHGRCAIEQRTQG